VPPYIPASSPPNNINFHVVAIPVTIANEGALAVTVLSLELAVSDPATGQTKRFYSADFGRWTAERARSGAFQPFAPIALAGYSSRTETVLFYTRGEEEEPEQIIRATQPYKFTLTLDEAIAEDYGLFDRLLRRAPPHIRFGREPRHYDARAFNPGTLPLFAKDWRSSVSGQ